MGRRVGSCASRPRAPFANSPTYTAGRCSPVIGYGSKRRAEGDGGRLSARRRGLLEGRQELASRIQSYALTYLMQAEAPEAVDLVRESQCAKDEYGVGGSPTDEHGKVVEGVLG